MDSKYSNRNKRRLALIIIISIITLFVVVMSCAAITLKYKSVEEGHIANIKAINFNRIETYIEELHSDASVQAEKVAMEIKANIHQQYPERELKTLKKQVESGDYSSLSSIVDEAVKDIRLNGVNNRRNSILVATDTTILCDLSYSTAAKEDSDLSYSNWDLFIDQNYNKALATKAVKSITQAPSNMVFIEPEQSELKNHEYHSNINMEVLREIYINEGIEGLKGYQLLVPSYIEDIDTDIFGTSKLDHGIARTTYRVAVVQRCNIYDQIMQNNKDLLDTGIDDIIKDKNMLINFLYIIDIVTTIAFIISILQSCFVFNKYIIGEEKKDK